MMSPNSRIAALAAIAAAFAVPAMAQDVTTATDQAAPLTTASVSTMGYGDWSGGYAGAALGWGNFEGDDTFGEEIDGANYGVFGGYQYDWGSIVIGGEVEYLWTDWSDDVSGVDVDNLTRAKIRLGYDAGSILPYAVFGAAWMSTSGAIDDSDQGYIFGAGADFAVRDNVLVGIEALRHEFEDYAGSGIDLTATTITGRVAYTF